MSVFVIIKSFKKLSHKCINQAVQNSPERMLNWA